jgi:hypothetical protein
MIAHRLNDSERARRCPNAFKALYEKMNKYEYLLFNYMKFD